MIRRGVLCIFSRVTTAFETRGITTCLVSFKWEDCERSNSPADLIDEDGNFVEEFGGLNPYGEEEEEVDDDNVHDERYLSALVPNRLPQYFPYRPSPTDTNHYRISQSLW